MRLATSIYSDLLTLHSGDAHRAIAPGDVVDLDESFGRGTLADAIGERIAGFEIETPKKAADTKKPAPADTPAPKE